MLRVSVCTHPLICCKSAAYLSMYKKIQGKKPKHTDWNTKRKRKTLKQMNQNIKNSMTWNEIPNTQLCVFRCSFSFMCLLLRYNERNKLLKDEENIIQCFHCTYTVNSIAAAATETKTANRTAIYVCGYCLTVCFSQRLDTVPVGRFDNFIVIRLNNRNCAFVSYIQTVEFINCRRK